LKREILLLMILSIAIVSCDLIPQEEVRWTPKPTVEDKISEPIIEIGGEEIKEEEMTKKPEKESFEGIVEKEFKEGDLVGFPNLVEKDEDGDDITYTFTDPLDENGEWQTEMGDAGKYKIMITARDSKGAETTKEVVLVIKAVNRAPVISLDDINVKEGETVSIEADISDPEDDDFTVTYSGWMDSDTKETGFEDVGSYEVTITAEDSKGAISEKEIKVIVENVNRKPRLTVKGDLTLKEGIMFELRATVSDEDGDKVEVSFSKPFSDDGTWQTKEGDAGDYEVTITASDGTDEVEETLRITVIPLNRAPILTLEYDEIIVDEDSLIIIEASVEDPDGDAVKITYSGWMSSSEKITTFDDAGEYVVTVTATDSKGLKTEKQVSIIVKDVNRAPVIVI